MLNWRCSTLCVICTDLEPTHTIRVARLPGRSSEPSRGCRPPAYAGSSDSQTRQGGAIFSQEEQHGYTWRSAGYFGFGGFPVGHHFGRRRFWRGWGWGDLNHRLNRSDYRYHGGRERGCLLYTSPSPRDGLLYRMPSSA